MRKILIVLIIHIALISNAQTADEFNNSGIEKYNTNDFKGAIKDFNKAIFKNYRISEYYYNKAEAQIGDNQALNALSNYNQAIRINPDISYYYSSRGYCKYTADQGKLNYKRYLDDYNKSIKLDSSVASNYSFIGFCKFHLKDYKGAIIDYSKSISLDSSVSIAYLYRGLARINFKDNSGCIDLHKAKILGDSAAIEFIERHCSESSINTTLDSSFNTNPVLLINKIDSIQQFNIFYARNKIHVGLIGRKVFDLPINQCITKKIIALISINEKGSITKCVLHKGSENSFLDSLIIRTIYNIKDEWTPFFKNGQAISYSEIFSFGARSIRIYKDKGPWIEKTYERNIHEQVRYQYRYITEKTNYNYSKEKCENNNHYYRKGIEEFKKKKYKLAKYNFIKAIEYNANDLEAKYNLGMSYLRLEKIEKACEQFEICAKRGDSAAQNQITKICNSQ
jgi:tetratricopeptide (TPR) repeat protein